MCSWYFESSCNLAFILNPVFKKKKILPTNLSLQPCTAQNDVSLQCLGGQSLDVTISNIKEKKLL